MTDNSIELGTPPRYDRGATRYDRADPVEAVDTKPFWKVPPLHKRDVRLLFAVYVGLTAIYTLVGLAIVKWWEPSAAGRADADVNRWFADGRTDSRTRLADIGSAISNTETKIALVLVMLPLMLWMYRRWHDWALITVGLLLEVSVFGTASKLVGRERPPVEQLDGAPTHSWPSGHIAASIVFYVGLAVIIFWNNRSRLSRAVAIAMAIAAPTAVIVSRLYLGMHYPTDVLGGVVLGFTSLAIVRALLLRSGTMVSAPVRANGTPRSSIKAA